MIHREALERSTASGLGLNRTSFMLGTSIISSSMASSQDYGKQDENNENNFQADDFDDGYDDDDVGGGFDLHDDNDQAAPSSSTDNGHGVDNFLAMDNLADKYSSDSFQNDFTLMDDHEDGDPEYSHTRSSGGGNGRGLNVTFLDEICAGDAFTQSGSGAGYSNKYNYFNPAALEKLTSGNQWAGSAHWKKKNATPRKGRRGTANATMEEGGPVAAANGTKRKDSKRGRSKKEVKQRTYVDFAACDECLQTLLKTSKKKSTRGRDKSKSNHDGDAQQMTKAMRQKHGKDHNVLPRDAGIDVKQFTKFFMRPDANLANGSASLVGSRKGNANAPVRKSVGFLGIDSEQFHDDGMQNDDFYGDDDDHDDGPGFELHANDNNTTNNNDDYIIKELEGVRKVEKVRVSHATVAKKVDVKRLKKDLWNELEVSTAAKASSAGTAMAAAADPLSIDYEKDNTCLNDEDKNLCSVPATEDSRAIQTCNSDDDNTQLVSFKDTIHKLGATEAQEDVSLAFYFICVLHLANEKGLKLENGEHGLNDFVISRDGEVGSLQ